MRPLREEYELRHTGTLPMRILIGVSLAWFYASLALYMGLSARRGRLSASLLRAYALTLLQTALFVLLYAPPNAERAAVQIAAFGGNLFFPVILLGWSLADRVRLRRPF
jgi:hypothetical protein